MLYVTLLSRCVPRIIFVACGLFLLLAAVLKTAQVGSGVGSGNDLITYRPAFITLVVFEFALGAWLVCGIYPHTARTVAILCFSIFTLASVYQAALGRVSCGCFGHFEVAPWITVLADTIATVLLSQLPPPPGVRWNRTTACIAGAIGFFAIVLLWRALSPPSELSRIVVTPATINLGIIRAGQRADASFELANRTGHDVKIESVESTCPCLSVRHETDAIGPGRAIRATVVLDLSTEPGFTGSLGITLTARSANNDVVYVILITVDVTL